MPQWMGCPLQGDCPYILASRCSLNRRPKKPTTFFSLVLFKSIVGVVIARQLLPFAFAAIRHSRGASSK
eukprot:5500335-Amphidinium_carterae.1